MLYNSASNENDIVDDDDDDDDTGLPPHVSRNWFVSHPLKLYAAQDLLLCLIMCKNWICRPEISPKLHMGTGNPYLDLIWEQMRLPSWE
ncbi:hypothetical protein L1049_000070 [Liquidambar formosana]|uniref:Uncharacterized protein n=1 Tax=Liquidambar formosana TaxID=63359 RepID=A0AAP0N852_LIQFO